ncbi:MAG: hypothetical protein FJ306_08710 [Planctomycetes bacterium]|nr:hypothetical protein [Planctomycetota bacterium]
MEPSNASKLAQFAAVAVGVGATCFWLQRRAARRAADAPAIGDGHLLAYPRALAWLGAATAAVFLPLGVFLALATSAGLLAAAVVIAFGSLGIALAVTAASERYIVDAAGVVGHGVRRQRTLRWADLAAVRALRAGGVRLIGRDGTRIDCAAMLVGFGRLCDRLLQHAPADVRIDGAAAAVVVPAATLPLHALQHAYARWFEREADEADDAGPPSGMTRDEVAAAAGAAFAARLLSCRGSLLPFEAHVADDGALRITHGEPRGDATGFAALRCDGKAVVVATPAGEQRVALQTADA